MERNKRRKVREEKERIEEKKEKKEKESEREGERDEEEINILKHYGILVKALSSHLRGVYVLNSILSRC